MAIRETIRDITITHGTLTVRVPADIFHGTAGEIDEEKAGAYRKLLMERYPWLTSNSVDVLLRKAKKEYTIQADNASKGCRVAKELAASGKYEEAIRHLERHLEKNPNDADTWYALGEILCTSGRTKEGYEALARGRKLI